MNKKIYIIILISLISVFIGIIYYSYYKRIDSYVILNINEDKIIINKDNISNNYNLSTLNTKFDTNIKVNAKNAKVYINNKLINDEYILKNLEIDKDKKIKISVKFKYSIVKHNVYINTLPSDFPNYIVTGEAKTNQEYYLTTYDNGVKNNHYIYILNKYGKIEFYRKTNLISYSFKKNESDGKIFYTYLEECNYKYDGFNDSSPSKLVVLDENFNFLKEIKYKTEDNYIDLDSHDYYFFSDNHYIISGYDKKEITYNNAKYKFWNLRIEEIENDNVIWEFESSKYNKLINSYNDVSPLNDGINYVNIMHINSMAIDPIDGNLICSFRNQDSIMKISRKTGKIMWILGGKNDEFGLKESQLFSKQHSVSYLPSHEIIIYDNGDKNQQSRIVKIKLDEKNKKVISYKSYELKYFSPRMGSIFVQDFENDIYLISYGVGNKYAFEQISLENEAKYWQFNIPNSNDMYYVYNFD